MPTDPFVPISVQQIPSGKYRYNVIQKHRLIWDWATLANRVLKYIYLSVRTMRDSCFVCSYQETYNHALNSQHVSVYLNMIIKKQLINE